VGLRPAAGPGRARRAVGAASLRRPSPHPRGRPPVPIRPCQGAAFAQHQHRLAVPVLQADELLGPCIRGKRERRVGQPGRAVIARHLAEPHADQARDGTGFGQGFNALFRRQRLASGIVVC